MTHRDRTRQTRGTLLAASIAAVLTHSQALAVPAAAGAGNDDLGEIVVTARQREEKLVDVPVTIQAFTSSEIQAAGIERPQDFIALTPGVSQVQTAEVGDMQVSIRGINTGRDAETNFALVIDGVLQTNPTGFNQEFANITQIEVLKGPQGALYGRNAVAGAMIISTKRPGDAFEADINVGAGNKALKKANLWIAGPITTGVDVGLGAFYRKTNGFFSNSYLKCDDCADYYEEKGVAPRLMFKVGDSGSVDVKARWSKIDAGAINFNAAFALPAFAAFLNNPDFNQNANTHGFLYINNVKPVNKQETKQVSIKGDWKLDVGTLTAWAAYNDQTNYFLTDGTSAAFGIYSATPRCIADLTVRTPGAPLPSPTFYAGLNSVLPPYSPATCDGYQYQQRDQKDTSVEIRLASPGDQRVRWQGGLYYADIKRHVVVSQGSDPGTGNLLAQAFVPTSGPNPTDLLYDDNFRSKVSAAFGQIAVDVVPNVEVAVAARYDREKRSVDNNVPRVNPQTVGFGPFGVPACGPTGPNARCTSFINPYYNANPTATSIPSRNATFSKFEPKLSLNWKIQETVSLYASWGVGFRSGGFNSSGTAATIQQAFGTFQYTYPNGTKVTQLPVASAAFPNGIGDQYKGETSKAAEVGMKAELLDRTLQFGLAAYRTRVDNMQIFNFYAGPFGLLRTVTNVDQATLKGVEGDVRWRVGRYVTLFAGAGSVSSRIDAYSGRPYTVGNAVPYAPNYTGNAGVDLRVPFSDALSLAARVDMSAVGRTWFSTVQNQCVQTLFGPPGCFGVDPQTGIGGTARNAYQVYNARVGLQGGNWDVTAWSRNFTNKKYLAEVIPAPEFGGSFIHSATGRAYGVDVGYRFQ